MNESTTIPNGDLNAKEEKKNPAFHLFLYLVTFLSLGFVVSGSITIFFQWFNKLIADTEDVASFSSRFDPNALKFGIASLLVAMPIFFLVQFFINRKLTKGEIEVGSVVRKFLTYLALVIFSAMGLGSIVSLLYNYLDGELTQKIFLKIVAFFTISTFYFGFYLWEIRRKVFEKKPFLVLFVISILLNLAAVSIGFAIVDSPTVARQKKQDNQLLDRMNSLHYEIKNFYEDKEKLPKVENNEVRKEDGIEYVITGEKEYQLCADFMQSSEGSTDYLAETWEHPAGKHCFEMSVLNDLPKGAKQPKFD